jgi:hypothetical protein
VLDTDAPTGQALTTPLMVSLARAIYNPRPGELAGALRDPAELCRPDLADREAVESLLFDAFIPAAYRHATGRWKARDAERWLAFFADQLEHNLGGADITWWGLSYAGLFNPFVFIPGLAPGLAGLAVGLGVGFVAGIGAGIGVWLVAELLALCAVFIYGMRSLYGGGSPPGLRGEPPGLTGKPGDLTAAAGPRAVLGHDRQAALISMFMPGVASGLGAALIAGPFGLAASLKAGPTGLAAGLAFGVWRSVLHTAWPTYVAARWWLALRHRLPWSLMGFLADAHRRDVLRQAGAVYQFRHIELQRRLATRPSEACAKAIERLGSDTPGARIDAIYLLERIACDSTIDYRLVIDVLSTFIREHSHDPQSSTSEVRVNRLSTRPDVQAAATVIGHLNHRYQSGYRWWDNPTAQDIRTDLTSANLNGADLTRAYLTNAKLNGADLSRAELTRADLTGAYLTNAKLNGANLTGANLTRADLTGANLTRADLTGARFTDANLTAAQMSKDEPTPEGWVRAHPSGLLRRAMRDADVGN